MHLLRAASGEAANAARTHTLRCFEAGPLARLTQTEKNDGDFYTRPA